MSKEAEFDKCYAEAVARWRTNDGDKALALYHQCIEIDPDNAFGYGGVGFVAVNNCEFDKAITFYEKAIALNDEHWGFHAKLAVAYHGKAMWELAKKHAQIALKTRPNHPQSLRVAGSAAYHLGDTDAGIALLESSLRLEPNNGPALRYAASAEIQRGQVKAGMANIRKLVVNRRSLVRQV